MGGRAKTGWSGCKDGKHGTVRGGCPVGPLPMSGAEDLRGHGWQGGCPMWEQWPGGGTAFPVGCVSVEARRPSDPTLPGEECDG